MRERLKFFAAYALFWLFFLIAIRALFLSYNYDYTSQLTWTEILLVFWFGLRMDLSIAGYFLALIGLLLTGSVFLAGNWFRIVVNTVTIALIVFASTAAVVDLELYRHWGFRFNTTPLFYMGSEAMGSVEVSVIIKLLILFAILLFVSIVVFLRFVSPISRSFQPAFKKTAFVLFFLAALMFIPIRGSFTVAPMNTGFVYFHKTKAYANHAAINVVWNFLYSMRKESRKAYPENFFDKTKAEAYLKSLMPAHDSTHHIFRTTRPNIILFVLESFTAGIIAPLGGLENITPNLNELCKEGILFDNFYSSGDRTDKGLISILSGYPAQPTTSIIKYPSKTQSLPYLNLEIKKLGYTTSFVYGGDIDFANFRSYITNSAFDHITTEDDFDDDINISKWGVHDHYVLEHAYQECDTASAPFFKVILTLSSHEPFDVPMERVIAGDSPEALFLNSCYYTDRSIGDFITKAKQQPWWENTVVLFVADHGHRHPHNKELKDKARFHIPLLMVGGAIKKDTIIHTIGSQTDIANTLLAQLDKPHPEFTFSRNLLNRNASSFAAYFFNDGYGFVMPGKFIVHDNPGKQFLVNEGATKEDLERSKGYQQLVYSDYNKRQ
ncbi:MAG: sulfatase-like hydrolase/transferase [Cyclobacteriaceae bacterium]|nr:sulfatase-like hydrolase/transferase [Cyclobacteriaceae bacterium]